MDMFVRTYQMVVTRGNPCREQLVEHLQSMPTNRHGWLPTQQGQVMKVRTRPQEFIRWIKLVLF
jgi:hypothetical protein